MSRRAERLATPVPALPMLASTNGHELGTKGWVYEPKWDGVRLLVVAERARVRLLTRNGNDKAKQFPEIAAAATELVAQADSEFVMDGEVVAVDGNGKALRFQALQSRIHTGDSRGARRAPSSAGRSRRSEPGQPVTAVAFIAFDLLAVGERSLTELPWKERRKVLEALLPATARPRSTIRLGEVDRRGGARLMTRATDEGWEGLIAKRADSSYRPGVRTSGWVKMKLERRQEFVVGGFTEPRNTREHIGALLVGYHDESGELEYAGHVGTGFSRAALRSLHDLLSAHVVKRCPFRETPVTNEPATWVRPRLVVEVRFSEWTADGRLRHPVYLGIRDDRDPRSVVLEESMKKTTGEPGRAASGARPGTSRSARVAGRGAAAKAKAVDKSKAAGRSTVASRSKVAGKSEKADKRKNAGRSNRAGSSGSTSTHAKRRTTSRVPLNRYANVVKQLLELEKSGGRGTLELPDGELSVTSLDKLYFPKAGLTKGDLLRYYATVAPVLLPAIEDRPLVLRRYPDGVDGEAFYQQKAPASIPRGVRTGYVESAGDDDDRLKRFIGGNLTTLLYTVQLGAISVDPWHGRLPHPDNADWSVIDLDPGPRAGFGRVVEVALHVRDELGSLGLTSVPKTSGASGIHIMIPLAKDTSADSARLLAQMVATAVVKRAKRGLATVTRAVSSRPASSVYVDYLQNVAGKSVASVYSARARETATVSTPLDWSEVNEKLSPLDYTIETLPARLRKVGDVWAAGMKQRNDLRELIGDMQEKARA